jgi:D-amino-acid oxidase
MTHSASQRPILVLGAGVIGLSTAIRLREAGHPVTIWASELPPHTTSNIAAAIWYPYKAYPVERVLGWGARALAVFDELATDPAAGIRPTLTLEIFREPVGDPWWLEAVPGFRRATPAELPAGYRDGYAFTVPVIEMGIYLEYLLGWFGRLGGAIVQRAVVDLGEAVAHCPTVINCTGLAAGELTGDGEVFPIRGQIVRTGLPGTGPAILDDEERANGEICYIIPRSRDCIIGGTAQVGATSRDPDPATASALLGFASGLLPELAGVPVLEHLVGLRPGRTSIRLESEPVAGGTIIHNYGHGGAGVTLSWGCAAEVVERVGALA